jgi:hypothetical protein
MGETMLAPYIADLAKAMIAHGNYIAIVTNALITKRITELCQWPAALRDHLCIHVSLHYLELKRAELLNVFCQNIQLLKDAGISFFITVTANDDLVAHIDDLKELCQKEFGALCHINESRSNDEGFPRLTQMPLDAHLKYWGSFDSEEFDLLTKYWGEKRNEFCYAGDWLFNFYLESGNITQCVSGGSLVANAYENIDEPINFAAIGSNCPWGHCYGAHCWMALGIIPEIETPPCSVTRNRVCLDGSEWLQPKIKKILSGKLIETNNEYSDDKKTYINALMFTEYNNTGQGKNIELSKLVEKNLMVHGYKNIAILGKGRLANWLLDILKGTGIKVRFIADCDEGASINTSLKDRIWRSVKYWVKFILKYYERPVTLSVFDAWPKVDVVVVGPFARFTVVKKYVQNKKIRNIIPITEVIQ